MTLAAGVGTLALGGCDRAVEDRRVVGTLAKTEKLTLSSQRLLLDY